MSGPPFTVDSSLGPAQVAERIVQFFEFLASRPDRAVLAQSMAMKSLGIAGSDPVLKAGAEIARKLDAGIGSGVAHGYHNTKHFIETMLCALYLCQATGLSQSRSCRIVTAALAHDLHHDGTRGSMSPFRLETASAQHADHELKLAGCSDEQRKQIFALILATEPSQGVPYARGCLHASEAGTHAQTASGLPAQLLRLAGDADLAFDAVLLTEADVLPSVGLTVSHARQIQQRLSAEWKVPMTQTETLAFIDSTRDAIRIARFFLPNIDSIRAACA